MVITKYLGFHLFFFLCFCRRFSMTCGCRRLDAVLWLSLSWCDLCLLSSRCDIYLCENNLGEQNISDEL